MSNYGTPPPPPPPPPQPAYGGGMSQGAPPSNYLVWSILSTILCCLPLGVASIVFSTQVNSKWAMGDFAGAQESSEKAKKFAIYAAIAGIVVSVIYIVLVIAGVVGAGNATTVKVSLGA